MSTDQGQNKVHAAARNGLFAHAPTTPPATTDISTFAGQFYASGNPAFATLFGNTAKAIHALKDGIRLTQPSDAKQNIDAATTKATQALCLAATTHLANNQPEALETSQTTGIELGNS